MYFTENVADQIGVFDPQAILHAVPTLSTASLTALALALACGAWIILRRM
jgi:hypothetical protein